MILNLDDNSPIYMQIAHGIEDGILKGIFKDDEQIPSTTEISLTYKLNPATVAKGFNLLVDNGIIYKKRGVGMFVAKGGYEKLMAKRKESFYNSYVMSMLEEAKNLDITVDDIISMIKGGATNGDNNNK